jgi:hypothetical protein
VWPIDRGALQNVLLDKYTTVCTIKWVSEDTLKVYHAACCTTLALCRSDFRPMSPSQRDVLPAHRSISDFQFHFCRYMCKVYTKVPEIRLPELNHLSNLHLVCATSAMFTLLSSLYCKITLCFDIIGHPFNPLLLL